MAQNGWPGLQQQHVGELSDTRWYCGWLGRVRSHTSASPRAAGPCACKEVSCAGASVVSSKPCDAAPAAADQAEAVTRRPAAAEAVR